MSKRYKFLFFGVILLGLIIRLILVPMWVTINGDLLLYSDWGQKFWEYGIQNFYYITDWHYAPPNYPPILSLIYAGAYWLFDHKYFLPQLHNLIRIPPAIVIVYFYQNGYHLLLKLPAILADVFAGMLIYKIVNEITKSQKKSLLAFAFYLLNPVSIFLSGGWGQTDSFVSLVGLLAFFFLVKNKIEYSLPLFLVSLYTKPNWVFFLPLFLFLFFKLKPKFSKVLIGGFLALVIFVTVTLPFAKAGFLQFSMWLFKERILSTATVAEKLSVSAFNFNTIFFTIDKTAFNTKFLGLSIGIEGWIVFLIINLIVFFTCLKGKISLSKLMFSLFTIGFSGFLFLPNMLERYFFPSFIPMIILMFSHPRSFIYGLVINIVVFLNIVWAFFRRSSDEIGNIFTDNNFLIIRLLSVTVLTSWLLMVKSTTKSVLRKELKKKVMRATI